MLKLLLTFFLLPLIAHAGGLAEGYFVPIYPSYKVSEKQLSVLMHTLECLPDPKYVTERKLTPEEVFLSKRAYEDARAGLEFWSRRERDDATLINILGKLFLAANYGYSSATGDMLTLYRCGIKFFTEIEKKSAMVERYRKLTDISRSGMADAEMNWPRVTMDSLPYRMPMIVSGGYLHPTPPLEKYKAAVASWIASVLHRSAPLPSTGSQSSAVLAHDSGDGATSETDPLVKKGQ